MAAYNASTGIWSTCNSGGMPADGDEITVCNEHLYMDENANPAHTFTVIVRTEFNFNLAGWDIAADVTLDDLGVGVYLAAGTLTGTLESSTPGVIADLGVGGAVTGGVNMDGNSCTWAGTGSLDCTTIAGTLDLGGAATGLDIDVTANTITLTATTCGDFTLSAGGAIAAGAVDMTVNGDLSIITGTLGAQTGTWECVGTGALYLDYNTQFVSLKVSGTYTVSGSFVFVKALSGDGTIAMANHTIYFRLPLVDNWYTFTGTYTGTGSFIILIGYADRSNAAMIDLGDYALLCAVDEDLTFTADLQCGALQLKCSVGTTSKLTCGELHCAALLFGDDGENKNGNLETNGVVTVDSVSVDDATTASTWNMGSSYIECDGVFDGDNLTVTDTSGTCHIMGLGTGTLQNVATDNLILAHDFATYGANTNVGQDTHAAPGSMALCGVGY